MVVPGDCVSGPVPGGCVMVVPGGCVMVGTWLSHQAILVTGKGKYVADHLCKGVAKNIYVVMIMVISHAGTPRQSVVAQLVTG